MYAATAKGSAERPAKRRKLMTETDYETDGTLDHETDTETSHLTTSDSDNETDHTMDYAFDSNDPRSLEYWALEDKEADSDSTIQEEIIIPKISPKVSPRASREAEAQEELRLEQETFQRSLIDRPWEGRLYRSYGDTRPKPQILTAQAIRAGGMYVDLVSGESLSVAICCCPPDPYPDLNEQEKKALMERYRKEMEEARSMPLPDEDDADL